LNATTSHKSTSPLEQVQNEPSLSLASVQMKTERQGRSAQQQKINKEIETYNSRDSLWSPTQLLTGRRVASARPKGRWVLPSRDAAFSRALVGEPG
jgi:hypothetical protein